MPFSQGEIIWFNFSPSVGSEPAKRRPALVVSSDEFNRTTSITLVCPITTTDNGFPLHIRLPQNLETHGYLAVEQVRAFDLEARKAAHIEHVEQQSEFMLNIKSLIRSFL